MGRYVRWLAAWLPEHLKPPIPKWGAVVEVTPRCQMLFSSSRGCSQKSIQDNLRFCVVDRIFRPTSRLFRSAACCCVCTLYFALHWGACRHLCLNLHGMQISANGEPLQALYDMDGSHISAVSAVTEHDSRLFFGNLAGDYVSFIERPSA